ncbi:uncharacterized protein PAC_16750 [Phialocephala subalpina]|uniref:Uncharacterized protein n=1 Tax=Phialocephala subalpina TaxID=576137 RepID=A0A1L7XP92_9HELO|nr:uncharacterized protein PAC_16750 [Phialocephala subalpina]
MPRKVKIKKEDGAEEEDDVKKKDHVKEDRVKEDKGVKKEEGVSSAAEGKPPNRPSSRMVKTKAEVVGILCGEEWIGNAAAKGIDLEHIRGQLKERQVRQADMDDQWANTLILLGCVYPG